MEHPRPCLSRQERGGLAGTFRPSDGMDRAGIGATTAKNALGEMGFSPAADMAHDINRRP